MQSICQPKTPHAKGLGLCCPYSASLWCQQAQSFRGAASRSSAPLAQVQTLPKAQELDFLENRAFLRFWSAWLYARKQAWTSAGLLGHGPEMYSVNSVRRTAGGWFRQHIFYTAGERGGAALVSRYYNVSCGGRLRDTGSVPAHSRPMSIPKSGAVVESVRRRLPRGRPSRRQLHLSHRSPKLPSVSCRRHRSRTANSGGPDPGRKRRRDPPPARRSRKSRPRPVRRPPRAAPHHAPRPRAPRQGLRGAGRGPGCGAALVALALLPPGAGGFRGLGAQPLLRHQDSLRGCQPRAAGGPRGAAEGPRAAGGHLHPSAAGGPHPPRHPLPYGQADPKAAAAARPAAGPQAWRRARWLRRRPRSGRRAGRLAPVVRGLDGRAAGGERAAGHATAGAAPGLPLPGSLQPRELRPPAASHQLQTPLRGQRRRLPAGAVAALPPRPAAARRRRWRPGVPSFPLPPGPRVPILWRVFRAGLSVSLVPMQIRLSGMQWTPSRGWTR